MRRLSLVLPAVALALAGCTGGEDGASLEERRAAYLEQAEQVCQQANEAVEAEPQPTEVSAVPAYVDRLLKLARTTVADVRALEPPEEDRDEIRSKVLDPLEADIETGEAYAAQVRTAAEANDGATLTRLIQEVPKTTADVEFMREYGFVQCADLADDAA